MKRSFAAMAAVAASCIVLAVATPVVAQRAGSPATRPAAGPAAHATTHPATRPATAPASMSAAGETRRGEPAIRIGYDTTRITKPLKPDGTPDYIAAINEMYSKGVTKDNNAAVLLIQALGPTVFANVPPEKQKEYLKALQIDWPADPHYLTDPPSGYRPETDENLREKTTQAQTRPWSANDIPELAKWLKDNQHAFALIEEASRRTRCFVPVIVTAPTEQEASAFALAKLMKVLRAFQIRVNLAISEGRLDDAWKDIQTICRLGMLISDDASFVAQLMGRGILEIAMLRLQALAVTEKLDTGTAGAMLGYIESLAPTDFASGLDKGDRLSSLNFYQKLAVHPDVMAPYIKKMAEVRVPGLDGLGPLDEYWQSLVKLVEFSPDLDWNEVLRTVNKDTDAGVAALRLPARQRREAYKESDKEAELRRPKINNPPPATADRKTKTEWACLAVQGGGSIIDISYLIDRAQTVKDLSRLALALAAYHADNAQYPAKLADLAPKYIKAVPTDSLGDDKDFIYKSTSRGYILYSVGKNGKDDGGNSATSGLAEPYDIVVRVGAQDREPATGETHN